MQRTEETVPPKGGNLTDDGAVQSLKKCNRIIDSIALLKSTNMPVFIRTDAMKSMSVSK